MKTKSRAHTDDTIKEIKKLADKYSRKELAKMYFVDPKTILNYIRLKM